LTKVLRGNPKSVTFDIGFSNAAAGSETVGERTFRQKLSARRAGEAQCLGDMP
jgi:hypothetical protein